MKIVDNIIERYGVDKVLHFLGGGWIVSLFAAIGWVGILIGVVVMLVVSFIKELFFDVSFEIDEIVAACFGGGVSVIVYLLLTLLI